MRKILKSNTWLKLVLGTTLMVGAATATVFAAVACSATTPQKPKQPSAADNKPSYMEFKEGTYQSIANEISGTGVDLNKPSRHLLSFNGGAFFVPQYDPENPTEMILTPEQKASDEIIRNACSAFETIFAKPGVTMAEKEAAVAEYRKVAHLKISQDQYDEYNLWTTYYNYFDINFVAYQQTTYHIKYWILQYTK